MAFTWVATYKDGEKFPQFDPESGDERSTEKIDRKRLASVQVLKEDGTVIVTQHYEPGQRMIFRRRVEMAPGAGTTAVCYLLGWQQTIQGQNVQHMAYVFEPDGRIELAGAFRNDHPWFYGVSPVNADDLEVE